MFGEANAKQLLFKHPSDPGIISGTPATSPGRILIQSLPVPYKGTDREAQERSRNPLPSPTFFRCDDGLIGVPLGRAVQGLGLASNHDSPLGNRQTVRLKIRVCCLRSPLPLYPVDLVEPLIYSLLVVQGRTISKSALRLLKGKYQ